MENASKALMIAGTLLISMVIISAIIFMYQELIVSEKINEKNSYSEEVLKFNKSYESYTKTIYGLQLMSLAEKMHDYNRTLGLTEEGYEQMTLRVGSDNNAIETYRNLNENFRNTLDNLGCTESEFENLYNALLKWEETRIGIDSIKTKANRTNSEKEQLKDYYAACELIKQITRQDADNTSNSSAIHNLYTIAEDFYTNQYAEYKRLKVQRCRFVRIEYSQNGRVNYMEFSEPE